MRKAVCIGLILLFGLTMANMVEEIKYEAEQDKKREDFITGLVGSIPEDQRAAIGAQVYVKYTNDPTTLSFIRAGDKVFIKHPTQGKFFMKTSDFWGSKIPADAIIALKDKCPFPPHLPPKTPECPKDHASCPPKEEAKCDKHLADMKKFVQNGLLTKSKFECLDKFLKPSKPTLSYYCIINGVRPLVGATTPGSPTSPGQPATGPSFTTRRGSLGL